MGKLLREPALHFALLGILLFAWFSLINDDRPTENQTTEIVIQEEGLNQLVEQFRGVWRRNPTEQELAALVDGAVREEVLVREALALGLDRGDAAIRNRLTQKMQFLTESAAQMFEPQDEVLRAFMAENPDGYSRPGKVAFSQVYLGESVALAVTADTLEALKSGADPNSVGRGSLLPNVMPLSTARQVDGTFGSGFFEALEPGKPGEWFGPVRSGFGLHLVQVSESQPAALAEFEAIRDKVLFDWRGVQAEVLAKEQFEAMKSRYVVVTPDAAALQKALSE